ncbi:hypothetical protein COE26_27790 [Bacillus cereus]|uniref:DUF6602 domain-containing protein n=1 Tax=Bacillus cereus TaxID=1396 RepID=UPI000BFCF150|nr:DUF6602 domain-containing protein [Bacillus cereus]PGW64692.1 hypothetical protein COE26_27790 [Bacillus cereus]
MNTDAKAFQKTISQELITLKNRVRNLIGHSNWGEEGKYKESILKNIINRFLPSNLSIGTGFILSNQEGAVRRSSQIDIIVYDNTYPLLFKEGDFIITTPENVRGIVEVKTGMESGDIKEIIEKLNENADVAFNSKFNGLFVFEKRNVRISYNGINENLKKGLLESKGRINHICIGENIFVKFWGLEPEVLEGGEEYRFYNIEELAFSYFISNLLESVSPEKVMGKSWFLYPIESANGKEDFKIRELPLI